MPLIQYFQNDFSEVVLSWLISNGSSICWKACENIWGKCGNKYLEFGKNNSECLREMGYVLYLYLIKAGAGACTSQ